MIQVGFVTAIYKELESKGVKIWLDGGWAVEALVGERLRSHQDLDIAVLRQDLDKFKEIMGKKGYREIKRDESKMWDLVLCNEAGQEVEVHAFSLNEDGEVVEEDEWDEYKKDSLNGVGNLNGLEVRCVTPGYLVKTHDPNKRKLKETDYIDLEALRRKFKI